MTFAAVDGGPQQPSLLMGRVFKPGRLAHQSEKHLLGNILGVLAVFHHAKGRPHHHIPIHFQGLLQRQGSLVVHSAASLHTKYKIAPPIIAKKNKKGNQTGPFPPKKEKKGPVGPHEGEKGVHPLPRPVFCAPAPTAPKGRNIPQKARGAAAATPGPRRFNRRTGGRKIRPKPPSKVKKRLKPPL